MTTSKQKKFGEKLKVELQTGSLSRMKKKFGVYRLHHLQVLYSYPFHSKEHSLLGQRKQGQKKFGNEEV